MVSVSQQQTDMPHHQTYMGQRPDYGAADNGDPVRPHRTGSQTPAFSAEKGQTQTEKNAKKGLILFH